MRRFLDRFVDNISPSALAVSVFFWSWFDLVPFSPVLAASAGKSADPFVLALSLFFGAVALGSTALVARLREAALDPKSFALKALLFGTVGSLCVFFGAGLESTPLAYAGGVLTGLFQGFGAVVVGSIVTCKDKTNALVHLAACLPFNIVFVLLGLALRPVAAVILCALLPLLVALSFKVFLCRGANETMLRRVTLPGNAQAPKGRAGGSAGYIALLLIVTVSFGYMNIGTSFVGAAQAPETLLDYSSLFIRALVAAVVFFEYIYRGRQPYAMLVCAVVVMAAGLFGTVLTPSSQGIAAAFSSMLFYAGYALFDLLIWAVLVILSRTSSVPLLVFIAGAYAIDELGNACGSFAGIFLVPTAAHPILCGVLGTTLLILALVVLSEKSAVSTGLHMQVKDEVESDSRPVACKEVTPAPDAATEGLVQELAARYFLTDKEATVLGLLLAGRSVPYASEHLVVSQNTIKTHVRHIYAKLDIHNRQELLDLAAQMR